MTEPMIRLREIDGSNRWAHTLLGLEDLCFYLYEYIVGRAFDASRTNVIIRNLKKKPSQADKPSYRFKLKAIDACTAAFRAALHPEWLTGATFVPVPGSKSPSHSDHDDRMERICRGLGAPGHDFCMAAGQIKAPDSASSVGAKSAGFCNLAAARIRYVGSI